MQPYQTVYGDESSILLMSELGVQVYRGTIGTFALQGGLGFFSKDGKSVDPESGSSPVTKRLSKSCQPTFQWRITSITWRKS